MLHTLLMDEPERSSRPQPEADDHPPSSKPVSIQVEITDGLELLGSGARQKLVNMASQALASLPNTGQVRVCIVNDQRMSTDHEKFSGITGTTDVLTFDLAPRTTDFNRKMLDTDITVCFDQAVRQAAMHGHSLEQELLLYIIHGTLHCLGYNDHTQAEYKRMHKKEDEILAQIGFGATFFSKTDTAHKEHQS